MPYHLRPLSIEDVEPVLDLVIDADIAELGYSDGSAEMLKEEWSTPGFEPSRDGWVAFSGDRAVAYGAVWDPQGRGRIEVDHYTRPAGPDEAGLAVLDHIERRALEIARATGRDEATLMLGQPPDGRFAAAVLPGRGWYVARRFSRMERDLEPADSGQSPRPAGLQVRTAETDADRRTLHDLLGVAFAEHWGYEQRTYDERMADIASWHDADFSLWWLAALDGVDVGALLGRRRDVETGYVVSLGVLPAARHRGVARTLLQTAFAEFVRRGCSRAELGVDTGNTTGALALYESLGMTVIFQVDAWELVIRSFG